MTSSNMAAAHAQYVGPKRPIYYSDEMSHHTRIVYTLILERFATARIVALSRTSDKQVFVSFGSLRPSQQLWSCRGGKFR